MVAEQRVALRFRRDGEVVLAVVLISAGVGEVLMVRFVLVDVVEVVWEVTIVDGRRMSIQRPTANALKRFKNEPTAAADYRRIILRVNRTSTGCRRAPHGC